MWLSNKGHLLSRIAIVMITASLLGGCFRPLYGVASADRSVRDQLAAIEVATINPGNRDNTRLAYYTQSELVYRLNGGATENVDKQFRLQVSVSETVTSTVVNTSTGNTEAALLTGQANFKLLPIAGGKPIFENNVVASAAYDRSTQRFSSLRAARDAQLRVAQSIAEQVKTRIAAQLAIGH